MRILHVTPYWADAWAYGGIPRVAGALARGLADAGHHVTVCTTDAHSRDARRPADPAARPESAGLDLRIFPNRSNHLAFHWQCYTPVGLHRYLRDHAHEFDVAHLHACRNLPGAVAAHYLHRYGVPYVVHPNGTAPIIERRRVAKRAFDAISGGRMLRRAAVVIAASEAERRQLLSLGVAGDRIELVHNPVDLGEFDPPVERGRFRARLGLSDRPVVAFLGKVTPRKRVDLLVRAFAACRAGSQLVVAGSDMGGLAEARALAQSRGIADRAHFHGVLEGRGRLELLADADVVVYPAEHEVFGLVAVESLLAGTPVVVAGDSGCGEIVDRLGGGVATPVGDVDALARAIDRVLGEPAKWRGRAAKAGAQARAEFGAKTIAARLERVYERITGARAERVEARAGVTFVVPVKNGLPGLSRTLTSIEAQADGRPMEIIVVDDRSDDGSAAWLDSMAAEGRIRFVRGEGRGASAALNLGVRLATHPFVCQVDQDVTLLSGWMSRLIAQLEHDSGIAAVEGQYTVDSSSPLLARVMALDLEQRYHSIDRSTNHVCTGNTAFRAEALREVGGFDETLGYGNDVDVSRRFIAAGWRLAHCRQARSLHAWRTDVFGYLRQQYGFGYGRMQVVSRDRQGVTGDRVSPSTMMAHPIVLALGLASLAFAGVGPWLGVSGAAPVAVGLTAIGGLILERTIAGIRAAVHFGHPAALLFPLVHMGRDLAWVAAMAMWTARTIAKRPARPGHSMRPRPVHGETSTPLVASVIPRASRPIALIPCHNEAETIAAVIADVRDRCPGLDIVVIDDGSTDASAEIATRSGVHVVRLPDRMGVGTAVRSGLRYARRSGYDAAIRLDGDGQHRAADVHRLLAPVLNGTADAVLGSRFLGSDRGVRTTPRAVQRALATCLSRLTKGAVTDPTSGFCAFGPRALRLLSDAHPTGYAEPETRLLLSRHALTAVELPVEPRPRLGGRTSLTMSRVAMTGARVLIAMLVFTLKRGSGSDRA